MAEAPAWLTARPIAHRGLHDRAAGIPENTLAAADAAIAGGFGIECDVQLSADGEPMVFHDFALGRLTEASEAVRERRSADLAALAVAGTAERIPTLRALMERVAGRVPLIVEIKSRFDGDPAPSERTAAAVAGYAGPLALKSFDPDVVAMLIRLAPDRPRGIIAESDTEKPDYASLSPERRRALSNLLHMDESRPDFLSWRVADLPCAATYLCRRLARMPVMTWTVRTPEDRERAAAHADQMVFEGFTPD